MTLWDVGVSVLCLPTPTRSPVKQLRAVRAHRRTTLREGRHWEALTVWRDGVRCRQQSARCIEHEQRAHTVPARCSGWDQADGAFPAGQLANRTFFPLVYKSGPSVVFFQRQVPANAFIGSRQVQCGEHFRCQMCWRTVSPAGDRRLICSVPHHRVWKQPEISLQGLLHRPASRSAAPVCREEGRLNLQTEQKWPPGCPEQYTSGSRRRGNPTPFASGGGGVATPHQLCPLYPLRHPVCSSAFVSSAALTERIRESLR